MANTGIKQAVIAYKVRKPDGQPLDINGDPISESGLKQAIALLVGRVNPNPILYEVEFYFDEFGIVTGNPTTVFDALMCSIGFIAINPDRIILDPTTPTATFILASSDAWELETLGAPFVNFDITEGDAGTYIITATRTATLGQGAFVFRNIVTNDRANLYVINVEDRTVWILDTGFWNNLGFYFNNASWNF